MTTDITTLVLTVKSDGIDSATTSLKNLTDASGKAEKSAGTLNTSTNTLNSAQKDSVSAVDAFVASLKKQAETSGMSTKEVKAYNLALIETKAAQMGVTDKVSGYIDTLKNAKTAHENFSLVTAGSTRELVVMGHELATGNLQRFAGSMIVMAERINVMPSLIGKVTTAIEAMGISIAVATAGLILIVGSLVAAGAAIYGFIKSGNQIREFNKELILTGDYAGTTGAAMYDMAVKVGTAAGSISSAKEAVSELVKAGKFSEEQITKITAAAVGLHVYGGVAIKETVDDFIKLAGEPLTGTERSFQRVTKAVLDLDQSKHFLSATVLKEISEAERSGDVLKAQAIAQKAMEDADTSRIEALKKNLSGFQTITHNVGAWFDRMWQQVTGVESDDSKIKKLKDFLANPGIAVKDATDDASAKLAVLLAKQKAERDKAEADRVQGVKNTNAKIGIEIIDAANNLLKTEETVQQKVQRLRDAYADVHIAGIKGDLAKEEAIIEAYRIKISAKPKKEPSDGLTGLNASIKEVDAIADVTRRAADDEIKVINKKVSLKLMLESDAAIAREKILNKELSSVTGLYNKEIELAKDFHGKTKAQDNEAASIKFGIQDKLEKFTLDSEAKLEINDAKGIHAANAAADAAQKIHDQFMNSIDKEIIALNNKVAAYKNLPENIKAIGVTEKQLADQITLADIARKEASIASGTLSAQEIANTRLEIAAEQDKMAVQVALEAQQKAAADALALPANMKKDTETLISLYKDFGNTVEKSLVGAFGKAGSAAGNLFKVLTDGKDKQLKLDQVIADAQKRIQAGDLDAINVVDAARNQQGIDAVNMYGNMLDASKSFFDEQSGAYKALNAASKVFHAIEVAQALASIPAKLAAGAATMFAQSGWAAFAGVAAMVAVVASFGVSSGGGGISAADKQAKAGTGSILGDNNAKSDSIAKSLAIIEKNSGLGLVDSDQMVQSLKALTDNISGLASVIVQATGITGANVPDRKSTLSTQLGVIDSKSIDPIMHAILGKFFSTTVANKDSGLTFNPQTVASVQASGNLQGSQYSVDETTKKFIFTYSDKISTTLTALGSQVTSQLGLVVNNIASSVSAAAKILGMDGDGFSAHLQQFVIDIGQISTKGLTGDQVQKELEAVFSKLGDDMAAFAITGLSQFQKVGEGYLETLTRVANDMIQVRDVFTVLGQTISATGIDAIKTSEGLIAAAGDLDTLTKNTKYFITNFETQAQQMAPVITSVNAAMAALGQSAIKTVPQFTELVRGLDLNKASDQQLYASLIALAPAFKSVADYTDSLTKMTDTQIKQHELDLKLMEALGHTEEATAIRRQDEIDALNKIDVALGRTQAAIDAATDAMDLASQKRALDIELLQTLGQAEEATAETRKDVLAGMKDSLRLTQVAIYVAQDFATAQQKVTKSTSDLQTAYQNESSALQTTITKFQAFSDALRKFRDNLLTGDLSTLSPEQKYLQTKATFAATSALAATGDVKAIGDLQNVSQEFLTASRGYNASTEAYARDFDDVQKGLEHGIAASDNQVSLAQAQLTIMTAQVSSLININSSVLTVRDAIAALAVARNNATGPAVPPNVVAAGNSSTPLESLYTSIFGRTADAAGLQFWQGQMNNGASIGTIAADFLNSPEYLAKMKVDGSHAGGLSFVPKNDYVAKLHYGEKVLTAKEASEGDSNSSELVALTKELLVKLSNIDEHASAANNQRAAVSEATVEGLVCISQNVDKLARKVAAKV